MSSTAFAFAQSPFAGMPYAVLEENLRMQISRHRWDPLSGLEINTQSIASLTPPQRSELFEFLLREEVIRLLLGEYRYREGLDERLFIRLPLRCLPEEWLSRFDILRQRCAGWTDHLVLWPIDDILPEHPIAGMLWTEQFLDKLWPESAGTLRNAAGDPPLVITHSETGRKFLLWPMPDCVQMIVKDFLAEVHSSMDAPAKERAAAPGLPADIVGVVSPNFSVNSQDDYRVITFRGKTFSLTPQQASVVEILDQARRSHIPEVSVHSILERIGTPSSDLRDTFRKSNKELWGPNGLIVRGRRRGMVRLNI